MPWLPVLGECRLPRQAAGSPLRKRKRSAQKFIGHGRPARLRGPLSVGALGGMAQRVGIARRSC